MQDNDNNWEPVTPWKETLLVSCALIGLIASIILLVAWAIRWMIGS